MALNVAETAPKALRGLLLRSDPRAYQGLSQLIALFADPIIGAHAARTMAILSKDNDGVLTKNNYAVIRVRIISWRSCAD